MQRMWLLLGVVALWLSAPEALAYEVVSTRGEIEYVGQGFTGLLTADGAKWKTAQPTPPLPTAISPCPKSIAIYIHGFQNDTDGANANFAQAETALRAQGYAGPVLGFSWDSNPGVNNFDMARESANLNGKVLADLLKRMKQQCPDMAINVITHSLGARVALAAMKCGGCCFALIMLAPAVDNEVLEKGEEFGPQTGIQDRVNSINVFYNEEDDILEGTYPPEEGDTALGECGTENPICLVGTNINQVSMKNKMIRSAKAGGKSPNPDKPGTDAEDDHSGYIWCSEVMKCVRAEMSTE